MIEISGKAGGLVDRLGFDSDTREHFSFGGDGGNPVSCKLEKGEVVTSILVTWWTYLGTVTFKTSNGKECEFGNTHGPNKEEVQIPEGKKLVGIKGTVGKEGIDWLKTPIIKSITFVYN